MSDILSVKWLSGCSEVGDTKNRFESPHFNSTIPPGYSTSWGPYIWTYIYIYIYMDPKDLSIHNIAGIHPSTLTTMWMVNQAGFIGGASITLLQYVFSACR